MPDQVVSFAHILKYTTDDTEPISIGSEWIGLPVSNHVQWAQILTLPQLMQPYTVEWVFPTWEAAAEKAFPLQIMQAIW